MSFQRISRSNAMKDRRSQGRRILVGLTLCLGAMVTTGAMVGTIARLTKAQDPTLPPPLLPNEVTKTRVERPVPVPSTPDELPSPKELPPVTETLPPAAESPVSLEPAKEPIATEMKPTIVPALDPDED